MMRQQDATIGLFLLKLVTATLEFSLSWKMMLTKQLPFYLCLSTQIGSKFLLVILIQELIHTLRALSSKLLAFILLPWQVMEKFLFEMPVMEFSTSIHKMEFFSRF